MTKENMMNRQAVKQTFGELVGRVGQPVTWAFRLILQANGGWGRLVEAALRRRLGDDPRAERVKTLVIDTDVNGMDVYGPGEAYALDRVPIRKLLTRMMRDVNAYPQFRALFEGHLRKLWQAIGSIDDISLGAMMTRALGMGALMFHLERHPELLSILQDKARQLNRFTANDGCCSGDGPGNGSAAEDDRLPTSICQLQSKPGGNGSAIAQAVRDLLRHLLRQQGIRYRLIAINALPSVFGSLNLLDENRLRANAYAHTREDMLRHERPLPPWDAGVAGQVERDGPGYEIAYDLEGVNMHGKVYDGPEAVAAVAAEFIRMTLMGGPLADRYNGVTQNLFRHLQPPYVGASFGAFVCEIPIEDIIKQYGLWMSRLGIKQLLRGYPQAEVEQLATAQVQQFMTQSGLQDRGRWFRVNTRNEKIRPDARQFRGKPRADLPRMLDNYELKKFPDWHADIEELEDVIYDNLAAFLDEQILKLVNSAGLRQARQVLQRPDGDCLGRALDQLAHSVRRQMEGQRQQLTSHQRGEARRHGLPLWRKVTLAPRERFLDAKQAGFDLKMSVMRLTGQSRVITTRLQERIKYHLREIDGWIRTLEELDQRLEAMERMFAHERRNHPEIVQYVLCPEEEREIFERHAGNVLERFLDALAFTWDRNELVLLYLTERPDNPGQQQKLLSEAGIRRHVQFCCDLWGFLREELSVEDLLQQRGQDPVELAEKWFRYAAPLINVEELDQEKPLIHLMLMGSQHGGDGFWKAVLKPYLTIERTGDPFRVDCLYAVFRVSPWALAQTEAMRADYERLRAAGEPLHAYPESELEEDGQEPGSETGPKGEQSE
jgi:hypothetical protein